jgi:hypothetical protein
VMGRLWPGGQYVGTCIWTSNGEGCHAGLRGSGMSHQEGGAPCYGPDAQKGDLDHSVGQFAENEGREEERFAE